MTTAPHVTGSERCQHSCLKIPKQSAHTLAEGSSIMPHNREYTHELHSHTYACIHTLMLAHTLVCLHTYTYTQYYIRSLRDVSVSGIIRQLLGTLYKIVQSTVSLRKIVWDFFDQFPVGFDGSYLDWDHPSLYQRRRHTLPTPKTRDLGPLAATLSATPKEPKAADDGDGEIWETARHGWTPYKPVLELASLNRSFDLSHRHMPRKVGKNPALRNSSPER